MNIEINFNNEKNATQFAQTLKDENLRGLKVKRIEKAPESGALDFAEYMPLVLLSIKSGLVTAIVTQVFGLLKNGFFSENIKTRNNKEIELAKIESENQKIEINIESEDKKVNFKLAKGSEDELQELIKAIKKLD